MRSVILSSETTIDYKAELNRHLEWFETKLPPGPARFVSWLRKPSSRLVRFPLGVLLIIGGIFSILPVLGLWMLPLGLILIAQDIPPLEKPVAQFLGWLERKWIERQRAKGIAIKSTDSTRSNGADSKI
jgi:hypothetical protein